jgi:hypothetical protein
MHSQVLFLLCDDEKPSLPWQPDYLSASSEGVNELLSPRRKQGDKNSHIDEHNLLHKENT